MGSRTRKKARCFLFLFIINVCLSVNLLGAQPPVKFVQITDTHLYDEGSDASDNKAALADCLAKIDELIKGGDNYDFAVVTGDIGVEGLIGELHNQEVRLNKQREEVENNKNIRPEDRKEELDKVDVEITQTRIALDNKIIAGAMEVASVLAPSKIKVWLFLPGNNDLLDEDPETLAYYRRFIQKLGTFLKDKQVVDLCPTDSPQSGIYPKGSFIFVGFNNASFKNNDDPLRLTGKDELKQLKPAEVRQRISTDEAPHPAPSKIGAEQLKYVQQVLERVDRYPSGNVYVLYHIPEVDDYHPVLNFGLDAVNRRMLLADDPYALSSWYVEGDVRKLWGETVKRPQVKALFAGHFHDWRATTYENFNWMRTPADLYAGAGKLHVCPPLAVKRQGGKEWQARGFQLVSIDGTGGTTVEPLWYDSKSHTFTTEPVRQGGGGNSNGSEATDMKIFELFVTLIGYLAWPVVALLVLYVLRGELKGVVESVGKRIADRETTFKVGDWLMLEKTVEANAGKLESLDLSQKQSLELILRGVGLAPAAGTKEVAEQKVPEPESELMRLAQEYINVNVSDYAERVRRKDELATEMGNYVIRHNVARDWLAAQKNEGLAVALASAVNVLPKEDDFNNLVNAANNATRLHVMYRLVVAIGRVFESRIATAADVERAKSVLDDFEKRADAPLKRRIERTRSIIALATGNLGGTPTV